MMELVKQHFDKLLLSTLFLTITAIFIHALHHTADSSTVSWFENTIGQVLAALLTLMVGRSMTTRGSDNPTTSSSVTTTVATTEPPKP